MAADKKEQNEPEYAFVKERIIVERPPKKAGFLKRFFSALFFGLVFGSVSAIVFVVALPYIQEYFYKPVLPGSSGDGDDKVRIPLDDDTQESTTENTEDTELTTSADATTESTGETETASTDIAAGLDKEAVLKLIDEVLAKKELDMPDYRRLYTLLNDVVNKVNSSIVTITATSTGVDILEHSYEIVDTASGVIFDIKENDIYIMTGYDVLKDAEAVKIAFFGGCECDAEIYNADETSGIAVIRIEKTMLDNSTLSRIQAVTLGNSYALKSGEPVIAVGAPMGYMYTMSYGVVTSTTQNLLKKQDAHYRIINTNVVKSSAGNGFMVNLSGELVGILFEEDGKTGSDVMSADICAAVTISDLKRRLEMISNNKPVPYFGIMGEDVVGSEETPQGIYILQTDIDSPAYDAGILNGDIIVGMADMDNMSMKSLRNFLETSDVGDAVSVTIMRKGKDEYKEITFDVVLGNAD